MKLPIGCMGVSPHTLKRPTACGIDVRFGSYDIAICTVERPTFDQFTHKLVFYGKVPDDTAALFLMKQYGVVAAVGDVRPDATVMARLQATAQKARILFWRAQYNTNPSNVRLISNSKEGLLTLERTMTLDDVFFAASTGLGLALPQNFRDIHGGEFVSELCAPTRVPIEWRGQGGNRWTEASADHAFHALNYMMVAASLGKLHLARSNSIMAVRGAVEGTIDQNLDGDDLDIKLWGGKEEDGVVLEA